MNRLALLRGLARIFQRAKDSIDQNGRKHNEANGQFAKETGQVHGDGYNKKKKKDKQWKRPMRTVVSAKGRHKFPKGLFKSPSKSKNHFDKHGDKIDKRIVSNFEDYKREVRRIIESPVGGDILGHVANRTNQQITRYDRRLNLFVKGNPDRGVFTSFVPDGEPGEYYSKQKEEDLGNDGEE